MTWSLRIKPSMVHWCCDQRAIHAPLKNIKTSSKLNKIIQIFLRSAALGQTLHQQLHSKYLRIHSLVSYSSSEAIFPFTYLTYTSCYFFSITFSEIETLIWNGIFCCGQKQVENEVCYVGVIIIIISSFPNVWGLGWQIKQSWNTPIVFFWNNKIQFNIKVQRSNLLQDVANIWQK